MSATTNSIQDEKYCSKPNLLHFEISKIHTLLALICPALGGQIDFENLALWAGQIRAGQNEAGQIKSRPKLGQLIFLLNHTDHCAVMS